jgi:hypothetical protein
MEHTTGFEPVGLQFCRLLRWTSPPRVPWWAQLGSNQHLNNYELSALPLCYKPKL